MKRLTCRSNEKFTNITLNKSYLGVVENGTFKIVNDIGLSAVYPMSLFCEPKRIVKATPPSLKEIKIETDENEDDNEDDNSYCRVSFNNRQVDIYIEGTPISCGIIYINGVNSLKRFIQNSISPIIKIPLEDIFSYIISNVMKKVKNMHKYGFCLLSTNMAQDNFYIFSWLDKNCAWHNDILNPNSGNTIRLWVLT